MLFLYPQEDEETVEGTEGTASAIGAATVAGVGQSTAAGAAAASGAATVAGVGSAVITASVLTAAASSTDGTTFTTASISPVADALIIADVVVTKTASGVEVPTLSGNGLTWVLVESQEVSAGTKMMARYRAMGASPSAGAVTITCSATHMSAVWSIRQYTGVNTSGTNGSGAVRQTVKTSGSGVTTLTNTLTALLSPNSLHVAGVALAIQSTVTPDGAFAETSDTNVASNAATLETERAVGQVACTPTWASSDAAMISSEVIPVAA